MKKKGNFDIYLLLFAWCYNLPVNGIHDPFNRAIQADTTNYQLTP
jgi:hypothetical protein